MEELSNMLNRLFHRGDEEEIRQDELKKQIDAIYRIYAGTVGPEQLIINAGKYDALKYIHDENPGKRLLGLQRLILESRDYHIPPSPEDMPVVMDKLENMGDFDYDPDADAAYQQYKNQYTRQAKLANQNAQANAAAMTGGYGSSYGTQAGQNAYASTMNSLDNVLDNLYSQSKAQYNTEKSGLQQQLSGLQSAERQDYSQYQNDLANWTEGLQYKKNEYDNAYSAKQNGWQNFMNGALQVASIAAKILPLFFI